MPVEAQQAHHLIHRVGSEQQPRPVHPGQESVEAEAVDRSLDAEVPQSFRRERRGAVTLVGICVYNPCCFYTLFRLKFADSNNNVI